MTHTLPRIRNLSSPPYQGWTNYETFVVALWMDHDCKQYTKMQAQARRTLKEHDGDELAAAYAFGKEIEDTIDKGVPSYLKGIYLDLLNGALANANYYEIAKHWLTDVDMVDDEPPIETPANGADAEKSQEVTPKSLKAVVSRPKHTLTASPEVIAILQQANIDEEGLTLTGTLARHEYEAVNKFLDLAGAKWAKSKGRHIFKAGAKAKIDALLASGEIVDEQKQFQAFYTPTQIATELVDLAEITQEMVVLEPSAGAGAIADTIRAKGAYVRCIELNPDEATRLQERGYDVEVGDFLEIKSSETLPYDRVVMNPPFSGDQDIKHVQHAYEFLKPGGRLLAIMSPGFTFGGNRARTGFRDFLALRGRVVKELEAGTFAESGTGVKTVIVELRRDEEHATDQRDLFTAA